MDHRITKLSYARMGKTIIINHKKMPSYLLCNATSRETRVALVENRSITELFIERNSDQGIVGNIYKGKVNKVLPGMQVAFVDIGLEKAGFLYVSEVDRQYQNGNFVNFLENAEEKEEQILAGIESNVKSQANAEDAKPIEDILKEDQEVIAQVSKDPMGTKGARITSYVALPGRYLVYMPNIDQIGVSRRIESEEEKKRLKNIVTKSRKNGSGYIIRTAAEGKHSKELKEDIRFLDKLWASINQRLELAEIPSVVYQDLNIIQRSIRDLFTADMSKIIIDNEKQYEAAVAFCRSYLPEVANRVEMYSDKEPIFTRYGLDMDIERALNRKVWLRSGGYIVIDQTEALTAIDVNTGKFVGKRDPEETVLKTNMEAVQEIVYQLRLRNIGGLIIIDFIDMERQESKDKVYAALDHAVKADRSRTNILKISELGLVEMTRKRSRDSLSRIQTSICPYCDGRGRIKSSTTVLHEIYREIIRIAAQSEDKQEINVSVSREVAELMFEEESAYLDELENELGVKVIVKTDYDLHQERYIVETV